MKHKMTVLSVGTNKKLGKRVASWSRSVGPTCPPACPFLSGTVSDGSIIPAGLRCYAQSIERRYTSVATKWAKATKPGRLWGAQLAADLIEAHRLGLEAVRGHVGGDFGDPKNEGELDRPYIKAVLGAVAKARAAGATIPIWFYTHMWTKFSAPLRARFKRLGIHLFASVHTAKEADRALALGWRLAADGGEAAHPVPAVLLSVGRPIPVCPEQRLGPERRTCSNCRYCFSDVASKYAGSIVFVRH